MAALTEYSKAFWQEVKENYFASTEISLQAFKRQSVVNERVLLNLPQATWLRKTIGWTKEKRALWEIVEKHDIKQGKVREKQINLEIIENSNLAPDLTQIVIDNYRARYAKAKDTVNISQQVSRNLVVRLASKLGQDPDHLAIRSVDDLIKIANFAKVELNEPTNISGNLNKDVTSKSESNPDFFDV